MEIVRLSLARVSGSQLSGSYFGAARSCCSFGSYHQSSIYVSDQLVEFAFN
jgi:hypothetical protein